MRIPKIHISRRALFIWIGIFIALAIIVIASNLAYLVHSNAEAGHRVMVTGSQEQPERVIVVPMHKPAKPMVTFTATGDEASITCTIEGDDQGCLPGSSKSVALSQDRMAAYGMVAILHNQPGDTVTITIKIGGKVVGKVTASAYHQIAAITVYRNHPYGKWIAVPSYG